MNKALAGAKRKGELAFLYGQSLHDCPYRDKRNFKGRVTFSRAFRRAWGEGWKEAYSKATNSMEPKGFSAVTKMEEA